MFNWLSETGIFTLAGNVRFFTREKSDANSNQLIKANSDYLTWSLSRTFGVAVKYGIEFDPVTK